MLWLKKESLSRSETCAPLSVVMDTASPLSNCSKHGPARPPLWRTGRKLLLSNRSKVATACSRVSSGADWLPMDLSVETAETRKVDGKLTPAVVRRSVPGALAASS